MLGKESILQLITSLAGIINTVHSSGNAPVWDTPSSATSRTVSENAPSGTSVLSVLATDVEGDTLTYSVLDQTPASPAFQFDAGQRRLSTPAGLDAETTTMFTFTFSVSDTTSTVSSATLTVNIQDENEFSPVFNQTSYTATIYDTTTNGVTILTVYASDDDVTSSLTYSIISGDTSTFSIGSTSGDVTLAAASNLNPSSTPSYVLTVQVTDGSNNENVDVSITVLDDPCSPNPCQNSGTCSSPGMSYTCTCQAGWIGTTCSTDDPCLPEPCENSGTCSISGTTYQCACTPEFSGKNCSDTSATDEGSSTAGSGTGLTTAEIIGICVSAVILCGVVTATSVVFYLKWRLRKAHVIDKKYSSTNRSSSLKSNAVMPENMNKIDRENRTTVLELPKQTYVHTETSIENR